MSFIPPLTVFRVASPVRAKIALRRDGGIWTLLELAGPKNAALAPKDRESILRGF